MVSRRRLLAGGSLLGLLPAAVAQPLELRMAFGEHIPPFCFPDTDSGIEVEVFREALGHKGYRLHAVYLPLGRIPAAFRNHEVDATMTDLGEDLARQGGHYGNTAVLYDNVLFTLAERGLSLKRPQDLEGLSVIAFQGAVRRYPDWLGPVREAGRYTEINDQTAQVRTLMRRRYDVVLADRSIFRYFSLQLKRAGEPLLPVTEHAFTTPNPLDYRPVFRSPKVRDDFNDGLQWLKASGRYRAIYARYLTE
ncbi:substrate-binding periplasmic protein [Roseateles sp. BYS78W]|uniref:Substrate-binding periplasmic protein n=1 Tax=Pelomonas candidula TaxID=3299025 RepID=A0ABW7H6C4_9BURK